MSLNEGRTISEIVKNQKSYFLSGKTLPIEARKKQLKALKQMLQENEDKIAEAVYKDYKKSYFEVIENEKPVADSENLPLFHITGDDDVIVKQYQKGKMYFSKNMNNKLIAINFILSEIFSFIY